MLNGIGITEDNSSTVDLANLLLYSPPDEIDLANLLYYQQAFGDTNLGIETYLSDHHDRYIDSERLEEMISGQARGINGGQQSLGSLMLG